MYIKAATIRWNYRKVEAGTGKLFSEYYLSTFHYNWFPMEDIFHVTKAEISDEANHRNLWAELARRTGATDGLKNASWVAVRGDGFSVYGQEKPFQEYFVPMERDALVQVLEAAKRYVAGQQDAAAMAPLPMSAPSAPHRDFTFVLDLTMVQPRIIKTPISLDGGALVAGDVRIAIEEATALPAASTAAPVSPLSPRAAATRVPSLRY